jgi:hypothetical protein|nr:hypothetical protein [Paraburkholderia sp.]
MQVDETRQNDDAQVYVGIASMNEPILGASQNVEMPAEHDTVRRDFTTRAIRLDVTLVHSSNIRRTSTA